MKLVKLLVLFVAISTISSCKKMLLSKAENYFEKNVLNSEFVITNAIDDGDVITDSYKDYTFILLKGDNFFSGPMTVQSGTAQYTGTWISNEDYGKLTIDLPATPPEFKFLTRNWRFTSKKLPVLKFAPWGSDANIALTMERQ